jgi:DNA polymerase-3 subunit chi
MTAASTEVSIYQLTTYPLEKVLPRLLEKVYEGDMRALVLTDSDERKEFLNSSLWVYSQSSFLPHGMDGVGHEPAENPIWISVDHANKNSANVLVLTSGVTVDNVSSYQRCVDIFDGNDADALTAAQTRLANYREKGHSVLYWKQSMTGSWDKE